MVKMNYDKVSVRWTGRQVKIMEALFDSITSDPNSYNQSLMLHSSWDNSDGVILDNPHCGTPCCILGHLVFVLSSKFGIRVLSSKFGIRVTSRHIASAVDYLGFSECEAGDIFDANAEWWIPKFNRQFTRARTSRGKSAAASRMIRHWVETGVVSVSTGSPCDPE